MKRNLFLKSNLLVILTIVFISNLLAQNYITFTDTANFKLYVNQTDIGGGKTWLDTDGNYFRKMKISMAGQTITYEMKMKFDEQGSWEKMEYKIEVLHKKPRFKFIKNLEKFLQDEFEKKSIKGFCLRVGGCNPTVSKAGEYE